MYKWVSLHVPEEVQTVRPHVGVGGRQCLRGQTKLQGTPRLGDRVDHTDLKMLEVTDRKTK